MPIPAKTNFPVSRLTSLACLWLLAFGSGTAAWPARGGVTVTVGPNFTGSTYDPNNGITPADANGAIGPGHFMEFINGVVAVYNKTNGASVQRKSNAAFWTDAVTVPAVSSDAVTTDPRVIFDPVSQRWFATQVDFTTAVTDPTTQANNFLLAVSATANPTGPWKGFKFQADPDNGFFADFPTLGVDGDAVYISGDFYSAGEVPEGPGLVSIPKADLIAATPTIANRHWFGVMDYGERGDVLQPAICFDGSAPGSILAMGDIGSDSEPHSNMVWFAVQNAGGASPSLSTPVEIFVDPYVVPDNADLGVPQFVALQPDNSTTLQANDARLCAKVYAVGGVLYAVNNTELNGRIAIRWYRLRAADQMLLEQGSISDPNLDLFFPSIAANQYGAVVIGCNGSGAGTYISSYAYAGETVNGQTTFGNPILLQSGLFNYHDFNEVIAGLLGDPETTSRWGDYSATSVDPVDPTHFWTIQMYPSDEDPDLGIGVWSTQITELTVTAPPLLSISRSGPNALVSWPVYAAGYQLQSTTNIADMASWSPVFPLLNTNGLVVSALVPGRPAAQFFRLKSP